MQKEVSCSNTELVCIGEMMYDGVGDQIRIELSDLDDKLWVRYEVMDNMTLSYDSAIEFVAVMNNDFFNSLSKAHQRIILNAAARVEKELRDQVYAGEASMVKEVEDKINVIHLSDAERAQWVDATKSVVDRFVKENGSVAEQVVAAGRGL